MVDWGLALKAGEPKGNPTADWLNEIDTTLTGLAPHFKSLWMTDHFFWDDNPTHEAWTAMAYLAAKYPNYDIGPMVLGQSYRNPALLAKMGASLQALTNGRFIMAVGAGWKEDEYHAYGYDFPRAGIRIEQLEDTLEIMRRMWTEPGKVTYHGKHYQIVDAYCEPKPTPVPLIIVGGGGDKTIRAAAKYADWWNLPDTPYDRYADRVQAVRRSCEEIGRDPATMRVTWFGRVSIGRTDAEADARGGGQWHRENAFVGTPSQLVESFGKYIALGCDYFMVDVLDAGNPDVIGMMKEDVIAKL